VLALGGQTVEADKLESALANVRLRSNPAGRAPYAGQIRVGEVTLYAKAYTNAVIAARIKENYPAARVADALVRLGGRDRLLLAPPAYFCHCRGGALVVVSRFVEGVPVESLVNTHETLDVETARKAVRLLTKAIAVLHGAGVVHGDLRPANVILDDNERVAVVVDMEGAAPLGGTPVFHSDLEAVDVELPEPASTSPGSPARDLVGLYWTHLALAAATDEKLARVYARACCGKRFFEEADANRLRTVLGGLYSVYSEWAAAKVPNLTAAWLLRLV